LPITFKEAAIIILTESKKPLHYGELASKIIKRGLVNTKGKTPDQTLRSLIIRDIQKNGEKSPFVKTSMGHYGLNPKHSNKNHP